jgi:heme A synthase
MFWLRALAIATLISTVGLIVLGSAVRVTNSGMGCKGWPLCTGSQGSIASFHPMMEESHRLLASLVTILIIILALCVWRNERAVQLRGPTRAAVAVIVVQIVLGAVTVFANNAPYTVALHLLTATLFLGVVTVVAVAAFIDPEASWSLCRGATRLAWAALIALYVIVISGSVVVNAGAQSACPSWPTCGRSSSQFGVVVIQMVHRSVVLVGSVLVVAFLVSLLRRAHSSRSERTLARIGLGLFALQVTAGAMSAVWSAHTEIADVHLALASVLWSSVVAAFTLSTLTRSTDGASSTRARLNQRI